jgi:putative ABC transport system ATP-binding protein
MLNTATHLHRPTMKSYPIPLDAEPLLRVRNLKKTYQTDAGAFPALKGIDLEIQRGEFVTVVGKSGAGKSTLVNMITGIDSPDEGEILIDGTPIHTLNADQMARWRGLNMGIVFQFFQLIPSLTLLQNITLAMDFCNTYTLKERKQRAFDLLEQVGIADHGHKIPSRISGGQQQRVAIARALANDPQLIIADEPTGNLDTRTANDIFTLFEGLVSRGRTLVVVSHDAEVGERASRVIEIADGEIV